jgi:cytochrome c oxidase assembly factor CtaG
VGVIWSWHIPAAYDLALRHSAVHLLEHASFLLAGSLYWWHLLSPIRARMRLSGMGPVAYMASTKVLVGALGMGLAFAPTAMYGYYTHRARVWGLSALSDQSLAGILMALEQSIVMGIALVVLFVRALAESEREQQRRERYESV